MSWAAIFAIRQSSPGGRLLAELLSQLSVRIHFFEGDECPAR